jgi:hypothetical protein
MSVVQSTQHLRLEDMSKVYDLGIGSRQIEPPPLPVPPGKAGHDLMAFLQKT